MDDLSQRKDELAALTERLGLQMTDVRLYDQALTHASHVGDDENSGPDYEVLEFLGDAVLGLAVAHYVFEVYPGRNPGDYSRMRAGLINRNCVARVAQALEITPYIRLGKGEELAGGRQRLALLADCMEALIGAVYLDSGWEAAHGFVLRAFGEELAQVSSAELVWDYKSRLQHHCQQAKRPLPEFVLIRSEGPDHDKEFEIEVRVDGTSYGRGTGRSKKAAEQQAARVALDELDVSLT